MDRSVVAGVTGRFGTGPSDPEPLFCKSPPFLGGHIGAAQVGAKQSSDRSVAAPLAVQPVRLSVSFATVMAVLSWIFRVAASPKPL